MSRMHEIAFSRRSVLAFGGALAAVSAIRVSPMGELLSSTAYAQVRVPLPGSGKWVATTCQGCTAWCPKQAYVQNGRVIHVRGNEFCDKIGTSGCVRQYLAIPELYDQDRLRVPVIDHWWQTETGWAIAANPMGIAPQPVKIGSPAVPMPGYDVQVLGEDGRPLSHGTLGAIAIRLPLPPGTLPTLWNADARFRKAYLSTFPGYYETGDAGYVDSEGYLYIMARTDDVINVAGHRLSTGAMEEVLASHPDVGECAVIGVADPLKGQVPLGLLCLNRGVSRNPADLVAECVALVRDRIGPVAAFRLAVVVERLPKTRSGKILRATMVKIADGESFKMPATIDDPAILDEIAEALRGLGYAKN